MSLALHGGCQLPIAGYATLDNNNLTLRGLVGKLDGSLILQAEIVGDSKLPKPIGEQVAENLLSQGAADIIKDALNSHS